MGTLLTIYDLKSKCIAFRSSFGQEVFDPKRGTDIGEGILHVIPSHSELHVMTVSRKLYKLTEKDLDVRLEILFSQNLYNLAISMVTMASSKAFHLADSDIHLEPDSQAYQTIMDIHKRCADYFVIMEIF